MPLPVTYVLLVRHGENAWVAENRLAGRTPGVHLNDKGHEQAAALAEQLRVQPLAALYSSPLERCLQTAEPTAGVLGLPVIGEDGVLEVDYGEWRGGNLKELAKTPEWQLVQHNPAAFRFPNGETLYEVQGRAVAAIERIRQAHPNQVVAIFSHGDVIRTALAHYMGTPIDLFQRIIISTASISVIAFHGSRPAVLCTNYLAALPKLEIKQEQDDKDAPQQAQEPVPSTTQAEPEAAPVVV
jgi:probable phosphoglycerate mutase